LPPVCLKVVVSAMIIYEGEKKINRKIHVCLDKIEKIDKIIVVYATIYSRKVCPFG